MRMMMNRGGMLTAMILFAASAAVPVAAVRADPGVWYVKASNYGLDGLTGRDEEHAWGTLQQAHDNASAGDTIYVLPGTYDQGSKKGNSLASRLVVSKQLHFIATGTAAETEIVGNRPANANGYNGSGAIRCVSVTSASSGTTFTRFTFRDGGTGDGSKQAYKYEGDAVTCGGGICCYGSGKPAWERAYFIDCVITNCGGTWGAAMYGGTAIRCLIKDSNSGGFGGTCCSAALWNSVVIGSKNNTNVRSAVGERSMAVNSLICAVSILGAGDDSGYGSVYYNTLFTSCGSTSMYNGTFTNCYATSYGVYSPATGDFRPVAGMAADGAGRTEYITNTLALPEGLEMKDFNGNPIDLTKETCDVGAVQGAVEPVTAAFVLPAETTLNGVKTPRFKSTYARETEWPKEVVVKPASENFFCYAFSGKLCGGEERRFLLRDGTLRFLPSPFASDNMTLTEKTAAAEYWCSPTADAATATGAEDAPFRTIQDAIVAATNALASKAAAIINLMPGDYREGSEIAYGHPNRFVVPSTHAFLIRSTQGPAVTTIYGEADDDPPEACYAGCGPNAMRCATILSASADTASAVQGVTFADGHSSFTSTTTDYACDRVGGVFAATTPYVQILDSVVTNCTAVRGGAAYYGTFKRCRFYDCVSYGGVFRYGRLDACYVARSCVTGTGAAGANVNSVIGTSEEALYCTVPSSGFGNSTSMRCAVLGSQWMNNVVLVGSVVRSPSGKDTGANGYAVQDPGFVDFGGGDHRLVTRTPAVDASAGAIGERGTAQYGAWASNVVAHMQGDVDGNRLNIIDGKIMPGCYHGTVDGLYAVSPSQGGVVIEGGEFGKVNVLAAGDSVTLAPTNGTRTCIGYMINGVTNLFDDAASGSQITVTPELIAAAGGGMFASGAIYTKDWYADPNGDNDNPGFTPKTAKKTLAAAMDMTASGDTVHAAEGRYTEGVGSTKPGASHPNSRVYIPGGRSLVADGDADKTFIVGQIGTDHANSIGCGSNSVRCVFMAQNSLLRGFTLVDGTAYPANGTTKYGAVYNCGAVYGSERSNCLVVDCVITNCAAYNGVAGRECSFFGCKIVCNKAGYGVTSECYHFGCVIDGNYADGATCAYVTHLMDCTIGPNAYTLSGGAGTALGNASSEATRLANSLVLGKCTTTARSITVSNCVFVTGKVTSTVMNNSYNCFVVSSDQVQVDDDLRPIAGKNVACDIADPTLGVIKNSGTLMPFIREMRKRANNGCRLDAGALEADWRGVYAKDVGGRAFSVSAADNAVEESSAHTVLVPEGASMTGSWFNGTGREMGYLMRFVVPPGGSLDVSVGGETRTFAEGTHEYAVSSAADTLDVAFASTLGTAEILRGRRLLGTTLIIR